MSLPTGNSDTIIPKGKDKEIKVNISIKEKDKNIIRWKAKNNQSIESEENDNNVIKSKETDAIKLNKKTINVQINSAVWNPPSL